MSHPYLHRPVVGIAITVIGGTLCGFHLPVHFLAAAPICALILLAAAIACRFGERISRAWISGLLIFAAIASLSYTGTVLRIRHQSALTIQSDTLPDPRGLALIGVIRAEPTRKRTRIESRYLWRFPLAVEAISADRGQSWSNARGIATISWFASERARAPHYGDRWAIRASSKPQTYQAYYAGRHDRPLIRAWRPGSSFLSGRQGNHFVDMCLRARTGARRVLSHGIEHTPQVVSILHSLLLGYREHMDPELRSLFSATGTFHIFAISGLHVGLFAGIVIAVLTACGVPRTQWVLYLAPILAAYTIATGARASAVRASIMAIIFFSGPFLRRRPDSVSAVGWAAVLILAWAPYQIENLGFIFSFTVVLGLIIFYPVFSSVLLPLVARDPFAIEPERTAPRRARTAARYVAGLLAASCAAWLASAPLMAYYFGRFAPIALLGNLLVIPLTFLIVLGGCLSLVFGSSLLLFATIFNHLNWVLVKILLAGIRAIAAVPGGHMKTEDVPALAVAAWYSALLLVAYLWHARRGTSAREEKTTTQTGSREPLDD